MTTKDECGYHVLIPAYQPRYNLADIVRSLCALSDKLRSIVIVDDGSTLEESRMTFDQLSSPPRTTVIRNDNNMGKGAALKVGIRRLLQDMRPGDVVVTADADGQHLPDDILAVANYALTHQRSALGCRGFDTYMPLRSRIGNRLTSTLLRFVLGKHVRDTQTGLRALVYEDCKRILELPGDGYEYEFNCLIHLMLQESGDPAQLTIKTVYEPRNPTSHFNPVFDSLKIYFTFLRYVTVSFAAAVIDIGTFTFLTLLHMDTLTALVIARTVSLPIYFLGMRNEVFKLRRRVVTTFSLTCLLIVVNIIYLWQFIDFLAATFNMYRWLAMTIGASLFFVANFLLQNYVLYRRKGNKYRRRR